MRYFPIFLDFENQRVLAVGGGEAILNKIRLLQRTTAAIELVAGLVQVELAHVRARQRLELLEGRLGGVQVVDRHRPFQLHRKLPVPCICFERDHGCL